MLNKINVKITSLIYFILAFIFMLIAAFRGATRDTQNYKDIYDNVFSYPLTNFYEYTGMEVGFGVLSYAFNLMGFPFSLFLFLFSLLTFYFLKKIAEILNINPIFVLLCYLPVYFVNHQLMQIRQGLAIALAFYFIIALLANKNKITAWLLFGFGFITHNVVGIFLIFFSKRINDFFIKSKISLLLKILLTVSLIFILCRIFTSLGLLDFTNRISNYSDSEYSEARSFLHPANLRSVVLLLFFYFLRPKKENYFFNALILFYSIGVGLRLGFFDFLILSGRISTLFTFAEIFILPLVLSLRFSKTSSIILLLFYFFVNLYIGLVYQVPFIFSDYLKPLI